MKLEKLHGALGFFVGVAALALMHIVAFALIYLISCWVRSEEFYFIFLMYIGLTQSIYAIPMLILLFAKRYYMLAYGVLTGVGITLLLNAACYGIVIISLSGASFM